MHQNAEDDTMVEKQGIPRFIKTSVVPILRRIKYDFLGKPCIHGTILDLKGDLFIYSDVYVTDFPTLEEVYEKGFGSNAFKGTKEDLRIFIKEGKNVPVKAVSYYTGNDIGIVWVSPREKESFYSEFDREQHETYAKLKKDFNTRMRRLELYGKEF